MITVKFERQNGRVTSFEVSGHSGYAEEGADIVCASVSSVVWTTVNGITEILGIPAKVIQKEAFVSCTLPHLNNEVAEKADVLLQSMVMFIDNLASQYSDFISKSEV